MSLYAQYQKFKSTANNIPRYPTATTRAGKYRAVYEGRALMTGPNGLMRHQLAESKSGKIVSRAKQIAARNRLSGGGEQAQLEGGKYKRRTQKRKRKRSNKRLNGYFKKMLAAKRSGAPSFEYTNKHGKTHTYYGHKHPRLGMVYSRKRKSRR